MKRFSLFLCVVILLSLFSSFCLPASAENADVSQTLETLGQRLREKLDPLFLTVADELDAKADAYQSTGEILKDEDGNELDMTAYISLLRNNAAALRTFRTAYNVTQLVLTDYYYATQYIDAAKYRSFEDAAEDVVRYLATAFYLDRVAAEGLVTQYLIRAYCQAGEGDRYASFLTPEDLEEDATVQYAGIGVTVISRADGYADVVSVTRDSPAEAAGIAVGDIIIGVNGKDFATIGYNAAIREVRGEIGTTVTLTVRRGEMKLEKVMTRVLLTDYSVTWRLLEEAGEDKVGYIHISGFREGTFTQFADAVEALEALGAEKFIFDVRNNPGGNLEVILAVLEYITPDNTGLPLIRMEYKDSRNNTAYYDVEKYLSEHFRGATLQKKQEEFSRAKDHQIKAPMVVLCNQYTASAGELFTSCLKDFGAAEVIGVTTYGKGTGQTGYILPEGGDIYSVVSISTFRYAPPTTGNYEGVGVSPDQAVELPEEVRDLSFYKLTYKNDTQLQSAVAFLATQKGGSPLPDIVPPGPDTENGGFWKGKVFFIVTVSALAAVTVVIVVLSVLFARRKNTVLKDTDFLFTDTRPKKGDIANNTAVPDRKTDDAQPGGKDTAGNDKTDTF